MRRVVIVRHGDTFVPGETVRRIGSRCDLPLTERGVRQGEALGAAFATLGWRFDRVWAGPLRRTRDMATAAGFTAEVAHWLAEIDHGPDEGRPETEVLERVGVEALAAWDRDAVPPPDWTVAAPTRIKAWRGVLTAEGDGAALLFTSGGVARFAPLSLGVRPADGLKLRTGAYAVFEDGRLMAWDVRPA